MNRPRDPHEEFVEASFWHGSLERANAILAAHPGIAEGDIFIAAMLGDDAARATVARAHSTFATAASQGGRLPAFGRPSDS